MKRKPEELDVDFIGGGRPLTKEDQMAISNFIRARKAKGNRKNAVTKRTAISNRKKVRT
jgi:hypothetical protein